jgi:hypothetical protein
VQRLLGAGRFSLDLEEVRRAFEAHTQNQQDLLTLGESLPFGVFVATLWGEIRYMNTAMKLLCKQEGLDPASTSNSLPDVLCRLTGFHVNDVHQHLRKLVQELEELHVRGRDRIDRAGREFVLSWLKPTASDPADAEQLLVVSALPPRRGGAPLVHASTDRGVAAPLPGAAAAARALPLQPPPDEHAVTAPRLKLGADELGGPDAGDSSPLQMLAHGTPTFSSELALASDGGARRMPFVPEATLHLSSGGEGDPAGHDVAFVIAGGAGRRSRSLPVVPETAPPAPSAGKFDQTMPLYKQKPDDPP